MMIDTHEAFFTYMLSWKELLILIVTVVWQIIVVHTQIMTRFIVLKKDSYS